MVEHGVTPEALAAYDEKLCGPISQLILRNRGAGPFGLLNMVDERCGGTFDNIDDVIPPQERADFMAGYKAAAGFAIEKLNTAPPTIAQGARVRSPDSNLKRVDARPRRHGAIRDAVPHSRCASDAGTLNTPASRR